MTLCVVAVLGLIFIVVWIHWTEVVITSGVAAQLWTGVKLPCSIWGVFMLWCCPLPKLHPRGSKLNTLERRHQPVPSQFDSFCTVQGDENLAALGEGMKDDPFQHSWMKPKRKEKTLLQKERTVRKEHNYGQSEASCSLPAVVQTENQRTAILPHA